ncbi:hypothetical protein [Streptomyces sp. NPDC126514]|uniref:hypothetical protein n=1 Tax=Streptomyces sp. NPDC126514 TaxID=3155210 RepID=UPI00331B16C6
MASVRAALSGPAPEGACGPDCGCTTARATVTGPEREAWRDSPVSCTLRTEQWRALVATAVRREETEDGALLFFPPRAEIAARLAGLAAAEQDCCAFFDFTLHLTSAALELTVCAPAGGAGMPAELFGGGAPPVLARVPVTGQSIRTPGLRMPWGSRAFLAARRARAKGWGRWRS